MPVHSFNLLIFGNFLACVTHKSDVSFNILKAITHQVEVEVEEGSYVCRVKLETLSKYE